MANDEKKTIDDAVPAFVRPRFFEGKLMTHVAFQLEQEYHSRKRALALRAVAGSGALCGLITGDYKFEDGELTLEVTAGAFVDGRGRPGVVPKDDDVTVRPDGKDEPFEVPPATLPGEGPPEGKAYYGLVVEIDEEEEAYEPKFVRDRPCWEDREAGRVRETYRFRLLPLAVAPGETTSGPTAADHYVEACEKPRQDGVLLAVLTFEVDTKGRPEKLEAVDGGTPRQLVYTNPMLYSLIRGLGGSAPGGLNTINDVAPDTRGDIELTSKTIDVEKGEGTNELTLELRDDYVAGIGEAKPAAGIIGVETDGKIKVEYPGGSAISLSLAEAAGKPEYNAVAGTEAVDVVTATEVNRQGFFTGELPLKAEKIGLGKGKVVAFHVACSRSRNTLYFGDPAVLPARQRLNIELGGYVRVDGKGVMKELQVHLRSPKKRGGVWVHYWVIEDISAAG